MKAEDVGSAIALGLFVIAMVATLIIVSVFRRKQKPRYVEPRRVVDPQPPPDRPSEPAEATSVMQFVETADMSSGGAVAIFLIVILNAVGAIILFGSGKTYLETSVFGQLANIIDRTNGLLILLIINQLLGVAVLAGRRRTFTLRR